VIAARKPSSMAAIEDGRAAARKKEFSMKNFFKLFGLIAMVAIVGFSLLGCPTDGGGGGDGGDDKLPTELSITTYLDFSSDGSDTITIQPRRHSAYIYSQYKSGVTLDISKIIAAGRAHDFDSLYGMKHYPAAQGNLTVTAASFRELRDEGDPLNEGYLYLDITVSNDDQNEWDNTWNEEDNRFGSEYGVQVTLKDLSIIQFLYSNTELVRP
jgi:hypothetical protein